MPRGVPNLAKPFVYRTRGPMTALEITGTWKEGRKQLGAIIRFTVKGMDAGLQKVSKATASVLKSNIRAGKLVAPISQGTKLKRRKGKWEGAEWPAIPSYSSRRPLVRSGALYKAITSVREGALEYAVGIPDGMTSPFAGGRDASLPDIAAMMETGFKYDHVITARMMAYLKILYGKSSKSKKHIVNNTELKGHRVSYTVLPRPIWRITHSAMTRPNIGTMFKTWMKVVQRRGGVSLSEWDDVTW